MIDYQLNTRLNGNLAMTFCFHENKALQQDTTLYKFIWVRSGNLTLEIDHIPIQLEQDEIISLTPLQHIEIKSVEGEYLTFLFNSNFYCIFGHDDEVSCNGFLFHGSSQVMKLKLSPEQSANLNDIIRIFRQESAVRDNLQEEMLRIILKRFIITCTRIAREKFSRQRRNGKRRSISSASSMYSGRPPLPRKEAWSRIMPTMLHSAPQKPYPIFLRPAEYLPRYAIIHERIEAEAKTIAII